MINQIDFGGKTQDDITSYFEQKNELLKGKKIVFIADTMIATVSAKDIELGFDTQMIATQAYSIGRTNNFFSDLYVSLESYLHGIPLSPMYHYSDEKLSQVLKKFEETINVDPVDARFTYQNGRVSEFRSAKNGKRVDVQAVKVYLQDKSIPALTATSSPLIVKIPVMTIKPQVTNEEANNLGIVERIGIGTSLFYGSIPNRIYNLTLAASRLNGILIKPGEVFSFNKALGDVSAFTGYKQAYIIQNGRTVLGDGGGVCQVSTTLFRALLNAGLPIIERNQHAYRVHYYEEDMGPGIDAAIYTPNIDLKFKNDTGHHILIQSAVDKANFKLTFELYGTSDGRVASISSPVILSQTPPPEPLYQDDPTIPKGQVKQVDWAAPGARVYFTYTVVKDGKEVISQKFYSHYRPWQAVYLVGTKEG